MRNVFLTALREFKATIMTKAFIFAVVFPVLIGGVISFIAAIGLLSDKPPKLEGTVAVADATAGQAVAPGIGERLSVAAQKIAADRIKKELKEQAAAKGVDKMVSEDQMDMAMKMAAGEPALIHVQPLPGDTDAAAQKERVRNGELIAFVHVTPETLAPKGDYELYVGPTTDRKVSDKIREAVGGAVVDARYRGENIDPEKVRLLSRAPEGKTSTITQQGERAANEDLQMMVPFIFIMLLFMSSLTGAQYLLMSTIEEKSSRVMEVLLSATTPMQLMAGKIIGQGLVGLLMLATYGGLGIVAAIKFNVSQVIRPQDLVFLVCYFLIAYFFIASLFAAIGSAVSEMREAQSLMGPVMGLLIVPIYIVMLSFKNPNSTFNIIASFVPPISPFAMMMRISQTANPPPLWQVIVSTGIGFASVVFMVWAAAKIFRVGVLMYGKPPSLLGVFKWLRYS